MAHPDLSVVVPTYSARDALPHLVQRLRAALVGHGVNNFEIVIVNDGSPDDSWDVLRELATAYPELRAVDLLTNHGQPAATLCGLAHARGDLVATMDDDLQHPPEELPKLLVALREHPEWDAVVGSWPPDQGLLRNLGSWVNERVDRFVSGTPKGFRHTAFRVMRRPVVDAILAHETRVPVVWALLGRASSRVHNVEVEHHKRPYGASGFRWLAGAKVVATSFFQASTFPLRLLTALGMGSAALALIVTVVLVTRWLIGVQTPPGWASSTLAVVFFGGVTLFGVGLIGEYLALVLHEVRRPPRWTVRERTDDLSSQHISS